MLPGPADGSGGAVGPSSRPAASPCSPAGGHPAWDPATNEPGMGLSRLARLPCFVRPSIVRRVAGHHVFQIHSPCPAPDPVHDRMILCLLIDPSADGRRRTTHAYRLHARIIGRTMELVPPIGRSNRPTDPAVRTSREHAAGAAPD